MIALTETLEQARDLLTDMADQCTEANDNLADAQGAIEERDRETRQSSAQAALDLMDELESNLTVLRKMIRRAAR